MKKLINIISLIFVLGNISAFAQCGTCSDACNSKVSKSNLSAHQEVSEVKAYYFHATRRCATCMAVESVTKEAIHNNFGEKIIFQSVNRDKKENKSLLQKYKVNGQALLIVKGSKVINLTSYAFLHARVNPKKLKEKVKTTIESIL